MKNVSNSSHFGNGDVRRARSAGGTMLFFAGEADNRRGQPRPKAELTHSEDAT